MRNLVPRSMWVFIFIVVLQYVLLWGEYTPNRLFIYLLGWKPCEWWSSWSLLFSVKRKKCSSNTRVTCKIMQYRVHGWTNKREDWINKKPESHHTETQKPRNRLRRDTTRLNHSRKKWKATKVGKKPTCNSLLVKKKNPYLTNFYHA